MVVRVNAQWKMVGFVNYKELVKLMNVDVSLGMNMLNLVMIGSKYK